MVELEAPHSPGAPAPERRRRRPTLLNAAIRGVLVGVAGIAASVGATAFLWGQGPSSWLDSASRTGRYWSLWFLLGLVAAPLALLERRAEGEPSGVSRAILLGLLGGVVALACLILADAQHVYLLGAVWSDRPGWNGFLELKQDWSYLTNPTAFLGWLGLNATPFVPLVVVRRLDLGLARQVGVTVAGTVFLAALVDATAVRVTLSSLLPSDEPVLLVAPLIPILARAADALEARLEAWRRTRHAG